MKLILLCFIVALVCCEEYYYCDYFAMNQRSCKMFAEHHGTVCAIYKTGLPKTITNACDACMQDDIVAFTPGPCDLISHTCQNHNDECPAIPAHPERTCAFESGKAPREIKQFECCSEETYEVILPEPCPKLTDECKLPFKNQPKFCETKTKFCPKPDSPTVCRISVNGRLWTVNGPCNACSMPGTIAYSQGPCRDDIPEHCKAPIAGIKSRAQRYAKASSLIEKKTSK